MSGRLPLPMGKPGSFSYRKLAPKQWQARCRFRDLDGVTRQVAAQGTTKARAELALWAKLRERGAEDLSALTTASTLADAATLWLAKVATRRRGSTYDTYRRWLDNRVIPDIGGLRLPECTFGRLDAYMTRLATQRNTEGQPRYKPNTLRSIRKVISGPLTLAVKHKVLATNPVKDMDNIEGQGCPPRALTIEERRRLRAWLRANSDDLAQRAAQQAARRHDLPDLVDFMLGTGVRVGEALAVRWRDVDLDGIPIANPDGSLRLAPIATVSGNIVRETGKGLVRHQGKTKQAVRTFELPRFVADMLRRRRPNDADPDWPVFAVIGPNGITWRDPNNTQTYIRCMRDALGWSWMTSHNWRETAITIWSDSAEMPDRATSDLAGHSDINFTKKTYVGRGELHPQAAAVQDAAYAE